LIRAVAIDAVEQVEEIAHLLPPAETAIRACDVPQVGCADTGGLQALR
jgi:hypothetical protein